MPCIMRESRRIWTSRLGDAVNLRHQRDGVGTGLIWRWIGHLSQLL